jgi:ABC-type sugar transport system substrate-binding protein
MKFFRLLLSLLVIFTLITAATAVVAQESEDEEELGTPEDLEPTEDEIAAAIDALGEDGFVGVIACTYETEYHSTVAESAEEYATELGLNVQTFDSEINVERQITGIESFVNDGAQVIVICLFDPPSVQSALEDAAAAGVMIVQYAGRQLADIGGVTISVEDSDMGYAAGEYAAQLINDELGGEANVAILDYPDVANVVIRADNIRAAIEENAPDAVIVGNYLGGIADYGLTSMETALIEHPEINVVVSINDAGALGAMQALENAGRDDAIIVGIDADSQALDLIREGTMYRGTVDTTPALTGVMTINAAVKLLADSEIPQNIVVPVTLVTQETLAAEEEEETTE